MKVLLIHPPWLRFFGSCLLSPPIALNYIAASVKANYPDIDIEVYNADFAKGMVPSMANDLFTAKHNVYRNRLFSSDDPTWQEISQTIKQYKPDVVGISSMSATFPSACQLVKIIRAQAPHCKIVLGGRHCTALPEISLRQSEVDFIVIGDGEETFCDLLNNINSPDQVSGIAFIDTGDKFIQTTARTKKTQIDDFPMPIIDSALSCYGYENKQGGDIFTWSLLSARGCPFQCAYCATDHQVRFRSIENVMLEIRTVKEKYGITHFSFEDDTFSLKRDRMEELCFALAQEKVKWTCVTRVDTLDDALVELMKNSGCIQVYIGIETGSPLTLKLIRKNLKISQVEAAIELFRKHDLMVMGFFIIGFHWETATDMQQTISLIRRLPLDYFQLNIATPLPGTALFNELVSKGKLSPESIDWSEFHQGSLHMNFTEISQPDWEKMLLHFQNQAYAILKKRYLKVLFRRFLNDPLHFIKKAASRIRQNPKLLGWFVKGNEDS